MYCTLSECGPIFSPPTCTVHVCVANSAGGLPHIPGAGRFIPFPWNHGTSMAKALVA